LKNKYLCFGDFRLCPAEHLLLRDQTPLPLAPKAFDLLLLLVQNSGHLVKRDVLMETIWPDSFVEETNITVNISLLRKALGSMPNGQPYIETVPRRGYRFNAAVTECEDAEESPTSEPKISSQKSNEDVMLGPAVASVLADASAATSPDLQAPAAASPMVPPPVQATQPQPPPRVGWQTSATRVLAMTVACVALILALFYLWSHWKSKSTTVSAAERSIAILPFRPLNPTTEDEYLGLGMTDALITRLSNLHKIIVRPVGAVR
jgi:DNA-binding winged helix-turn-helix (wHTH) protein